MMLVHPAKAILWKTCSTGDGIIPIKECGQALSAAVDVLSQFHEKKDMYYIRLGPFPPIVIAVQFVKNVPDGGM
jgi:hypothetical protein